MALRFLSSELIYEDHVFGLKPETGSLRELPLPLEIPDSVLHLVHSDFAYLAYLVAASLLQAWTRGFDDDGPIPERAPLLVITARPNLFAEKYLDLVLPADRIAEISAKRRVSLHTKRGRVPEAGTKSEYWDNFVNTDQESVRFHNLFPAHVSKSSGGEPRQVAMREYMGRGDDADPAVLIISGTSDKNQKRIADRYRPILTVIDGATVRSRKEPDKHQIIFHESVFSEELGRLQVERRNICVLPDQDFDEFCAKSSLSVVADEPTPEVAETTGQIDSAILALVEIHDRKKSKVINDFYRIVRKLRLLVAGIPVGVSLYESALAISGRDGGSGQIISIRKLLSVLETRMTEVAIFGEWEELVCAELVIQFKKLVSLIELMSAKTGPLTKTIKGALEGSHHPLIVMSRDRNLSEVQKLLLTMPEPFGLGFPQDRISTCSVAEHEPGTIQGDLFFLSAWDASEMFSKAWKLKTVSATLILSAGETRFLANEFSIVRSLFPDHAVVTCLLRNLFEHYERLPTPTKSPAKPEPTMQQAPSVFLSLQQARDIVDYGMVLLADDVSDGENDGSEIQAVHVALNDGLAVFLPENRRVYFLRNGTVVSGTPGGLDRTSELIVINPKTRFSIISRVLDGTETDNASKEMMALIQLWRHELVSSATRSGLNAEAILSGIRKLGSELSTPFAIGSWIRGDVLGPLDPLDVGRTGNVVQSRWIVENSEKLAQALMTVRSFRRGTGRELSKVIRKIAGGRRHLDDEDREFLAKVRISEGELEDAVQLIPVVGVGQGLHTISTADLGRVIHHSEELDNVGA